MKHFRMTRRTFLQACATTAATASALSHAAPTKPPNIIVILADDMGYGDPRCYNPDSAAPTPNIDRLAAEGMRFTDAHTPSAVCTPTRYGVLTGRYCWRTSLKSGVLWGQSPALIDSDRTTTASLLKAQGYRTACVGKWHLGLGTQEKTDYSKPLSPSPIDNGFDYFFGIPASLDMPPYVYVENNMATEQATEHSPGFRDGHGRFWREGPIAPNLKIEEVLPTFRDKAVEVVDDLAKGDAPFYLYFPLTAPHTPWVPVGDAVGRTAEGDYTDFVTQVDATIGAVLDALDRNGATEDTLIIVTSDNGAHESLLPKDTNHDPNTPWRGQKADIYEGGHRVPFVVRWPGKVEANSTSDQLVCLTDFLATFAEVVDAELPTNAGEDSFSFAHALLGSTPKGPVRQSMVSHSLQGVFALRDGNMKYIEERGSGGFGWNREKAAARTNAPPGQLYDLAKDPEESRNLYEEQPETLARLVETLEQYRSSGRSRP